MHHYSAYGLTVHSELDFPELPAGGEVADVIVRRGKVEPHPQELDKNGCGFWCEGERACHYLQGSGAYLVTAGREILVDADAGADDSVLRLSVLGPAMALVQMQRQHFVLHGSAVAFAGQAVVFVGAGGTGKSTMSAMLHARGHSMITDDVSAIALIDGQPHVIPGFPQFKLWPDAVAKLGLSPQDMPIVHPDFEKLAWRPEQALAPTPLPLRRVYVLGIGSQLLVESLSAKDACEFLMHHWYGSRFGPELFRSQDQGAHFMRCVQLANSVSVKGLQRPKIEGNLLGHAAQVEEAINQDLASDIASPEQAE